ncbi:MAG: UDP-glucose 4-epimerase [Candidatus Colwellbacteria bacterium CG10_big_fil_rev_8_21_14_0_10_42_22]|uniref:UDP-glucose 4-epimerase n=1 Tax=Candidatus Colwellbacteria bacterium CG10_big_fil_rev_8_21_14_0_10_42_22 TaxID=1974540 RepID=A0A2H0VGN1_9BACT|nr:MAG: UDP-glucose 4-epimerase [Candidatus Colwellbacteria bacterium CG10_big_fil_rev_8_21_14_0_10_42_22]
MKTVVTGGAGFIGSHIVDAYINEGHEVVVIDNLSKGKLENLNPKAQFYKVDVRDKESVDKIFDKEKPDVVNHHAAMIEVAKSVREPSETIEVNVVGTMNLLSAAVINNTKRFIFASTGGAIYGSPEEVRVDESYEPAPSSPYGLSKLLGEEEIRHYSRENNLEYVIFRYANIYGERQDSKGEAGVVAIFSELMREGEPPTIFGDGNKTRDYVYVGDVVEANVLALQNGTNNIFNIGRGVEVSDSQVFETVAKAVNFNEKPKFEPVRSGEVLRISLDAKRAKEELGWEPKINFEEGVAKVASK